MVGMIVTVHGIFATGITSGLRLLAGEPENYEAVDFTPEDSVDTLTEKLTAALERLAGCDGIVIFADLTGGSPFNVSLRLKLSRQEPIEVIGGANLPAVIEAFMSSKFQESAETLAESALEAGKNAMIRYAGVPDGDDECEEE